MLHGVATRLGSRALGLLGGVLLGAAAAPALAQSSQPPFTIYSVQSSPNPAWRNPMLAGDLPYSLNAQILPEHWLGNYPIAGPHMMELAPGGRAEFMRLHLEKLRRDIVNWFPNPNYDGLAIIDYEAWYPNWTMHHNYASNGAADAWDADPIDDWRDYIRANRASLLAGRNPAQQEEVFRSTWLEATREFYELTLQECKAVRPHAKWGFYMMPARHYFAWWRQDQSDLLRYANDHELDWLYDQVDAFYPSLYTFYYSVGDRPLQNGEDRPSQHADYIRNNMIETMRICRNKPVIPVMWAAYHNSNQRYSLQLVNDINMRQMLDIPLELGAKGFVFWDWIQSESYYRNLIAFANHRLNPHLRDLILQ